MDDLVNQLSRTLAQANRFIAIKLKERGLDGIAPSHGDILMQLFACGEQPMQELARAIGRDPSTVTALVKKLAAAGYVRTEKGVEAVSYTHLDVYKRQTMNWAFFAAGTDLVGGLMSMRIIHYLSLIHIYSTGVAPTANTTNRVCRCFSRARASHFLPASPPA